MIHVGITGQSGFVGTHLFETLNLSPKTFVTIPFEDSFFDREDSLRAFVRQCDVIVHLAAMMRSPIEGEVYRVNMMLTNKLIDAMNAVKVTPCILFSSSIQEGNGSEYGRCKQESHQMFENWAKEHNTGFVCTMFPNLFGPGARPNSHSFIATFCYKLTHGETPQVIVDNIVPLKYIGNLQRELITIIRNLAEKKDVRTVNFEPEFEMKVTDVLRKLEGFSAGEFPDNVIDKELYETFLSYKTYSL